MRTSEYTVSVSFTYNTCSIYVNIHKQLSCICVGVQRTRGKSDVLPKHSIWDPQYKKQTNRYRFHSQYGILLSLLTLSVILQLNLRQVFGYLPEIPWTLPCSYLQIIIYSFQFSCKIWSILKASSQSWKSHSLVEVYRHFVEARCLHKHNTWDEACRMNMEAAGSSEMSVFFYRATRCT
jgi:hypothetical protein